MPRIHPVTDSNVTAETSTTLAAVKSQLGSVPNLFATLGHSNAALTGYLGLNETLGGGVLTAGQRERIALVAAQQNECQYCLSAHVVLGKGAGLSVAEINAARQVNIPTDVDSALTHLAKTLVEQRGVVNDEQLQSYRDLGLADAQIVEVVANVALNTLTNYLNHLAQTDIDFPVTELSKAA